MTILWALLFILAVFAFWSLNLFGLPGNWLIVAATVLYAWLTSKVDSGNLRWFVVAIVVSLALVGELAELGASALGVRKFGGSGRGAVAALVGSVIGAIAGLFVGIPIPIIGSVIAALVCAGLGAFVGALVGEYSGGQSFEDSWRIGHAAFWGRMIGTLAKTLLGAMMAGVAIALVFV